MSGASEVPADIQALAFKIVRHCQNTPVLEASEIVGTILHKHIGSLARPVDTGREMALEAGWFWTWDKLPEPGRKFIAVYNDGSGARMFFALDGSVIDHEGDEYGGFTESFDRWAYLPDDCEFWCETRSEEPFTFPPRALANPENGRG